MNNSVSAASSADASPAPAPKPQYNLFVIWSRARFAEKRILDDMAKNVRIVAVHEMKWPCGAIEGYARFYGSVPDNARRKIRHCGKGPFVVAVVRDDAPLPGEFGGDGRIDEMKTRYRKWTGHRKFRIHATRGEGECDFSLRILSGRGLEEWKRLGPPDEWRFTLPEWWVARSRLSPFEKGLYAPGKPPAIGNPQMLFTDKTLNREIFRAKVDGVDCFVKHSDTAVWSVLNEYRACAKMHALSPLAVPAPVATWMSPGGDDAYAAIEWLEGRSLSDVLGEGPLDGARADAFAADILAIADALEKAGIVHRDIFTDNLIAAADGHLKLIDWQTSITRKWPNEDPWVRSHPKFLYAVFGVNRDLPPGVWNDFSALAGVLGLFPQTAKVREVREDLLRRAPAMQLAVRLKRRTRLRLALYAASLFFQSLMHGGKKRDRVRRRLQAILGTGKLDIDARAGKSAG